MNKFFCLRQLHNVAVIGMNDGNVSIYDVSKIRTVAITSTTVNGKHLQAVTQVINLITF